MLSLLMAMAMATEPKPSFVPKPISSADKAEIIRQADIDLIDGPSARWRWDQPRLDADLYCSFVNSKNSMGGYVGWRPFYFFQGKLRIIGPRDSVIVYETLCSGSGYIPEPEWLKGK